MIGALLAFAQIGLAIAPAGVRFTTLVVPDTVYVGQQVTYDAVTLVDDATRVRLRSNPEYTPTDVAGVSTYDFPFDAASVSDTIVDGARFRRYVYRRALFPLSAGNYTVPPATLRYTVPELDGYRSSMRTLALQSAPSTFVAVPLPPAGRPVGFSGAVGEWRDTLWTDGSAARVGDSFTVTIRLSGVGNLNLLPRPDLRIDWAAVVAGDERVSWDSTGTVVRGAKEFDWLVTPRVAGGMGIPPVRYDYFDPQTRRYETAATTLLPIAVAAARAQAGPATVVQTTDTIGDSPFPIAARFARDNAFTIAIGVIVLLLIIGAVVLAGKSRSDADDD